MPVDALIVGLGNPGKEYERTRHNVGWWMVDHLADVWRFDGWRKDGDASTALIQPTKSVAFAALTFAQSTRMNTGGHAAAIQPIVPPMRTMPNSS